MVVTTGKDFVRVEQHSSGGPFCELAFTKDGDTLISCGEIRFSSVHAIKTFEFDDPASAVEFLRAALEVAEREAKGGG